MAEQFGKVGIIGLGALGILFGSNLLAMGADVRILCDEERAGRYRREGVTCNGKPVGFRYMTPSEAEPMDLVIFATKFGGLSAAMETAAGFIGGSTLLLSVLNGISSEQLLAERFGREKVIWCTAQGMDAVKEGNALSFAHPGMIVLGEEKPGNVSERASALADWLTAHGVHAEAVPDMLRRQWGKLMLNVGVNQVVMAWKGTYGTVQVPGEARDTMLAAMRETQQLAGLEGYPIPDAEYDAWVALCDSLSPEGMPSMRQDGLAGRASEVELFAGTIIREAKKFGLPVPVNEMLYERVKQAEAAY